MIIDVKKYLFIGAKEDLDGFFERAQNHGFIEFIAPSGKKLLDQPVSVQNLLAAIKVLRKQPVKKPYEGGGDLALADTISGRILALKAEIEKLSEEVRLLDAEIARVAPFGDFSMEDIDYIEKESGRKIQFFCMKSAKSHKTNFTDEVIYIGTDYDLDYFVTINPGVRSYPDMIEMRIDRSVGELQHQLSFAKEMLHQLEAELKGFAGHIDFLHDALIEQLNHYHLNLAKKESEFPLNNALFAIEAWVPATKTASLFSMMDGMAVHAEQIAIETEERVPTHMENKGPSHMGEDLVRIYDVPATSDKDPSGWVLWAFVLFFSMIVSDGGYGLLFLGLALYLKYKFPQLKGAGKRVLNLFAVLSVGCILWGVATSSYFGLHLKSDNILSKISVLDFLAEKKADYHIAAKDDVHKKWVDKQEGLANISEGKAFLHQAPKAQGEFTDNILLEVSLLVGVIHVSLSLLRYAWRNWANIGWVLFLVGGYLYFPSSLHATSLVQFLGVVSKNMAGQIGIQLIYIGIAAAVLLSLIQKRLKGLGEIANVIQVFADVLSYLRLYALALAGGIMAETFNDIGQGLGLAVGALVILLGHGINLILSIQGGIIHGLRLNFIEWYHYSFDGGGRLFNPLKRLKSK
jgi:V/A-type H+-transporting ATPase subunit I